MCLYFIMLSSTSASNFADTFYEHLYEHLFQTPLPWRGTRAAPLHGLLDPRVREGVRKDIREGARGGVCQHGQM